VRAILPITCNRAMLPGDPVSGASSTIGLPAAHRADRREPAKAAALSRQDVPGERAAFHLPLSALSWS